MTVTVLGKGATQVITNVGWGKSTLLHKASRSNLCPLTQRGEWKWWESHHESLKESGTLGILMKIMLLLVVVIRQDYPSNMRFKMIWRDWPVGSLTFLIIYYSLILSKHRHVSYRKESFTIHFCTKSPFQFNQIQLVTYVLEPPAQEGA